MGGERVGGGGGSRGQERGQKRGVKRERRVKLELISLARSLATISTHVM